MSTLNTLPTYKLSSKLLRKIFSQYFSARSLDLEQSQEMLARSLSIIECAIAEICKRYTKLELLFLLRTKVPPQLILGGSTTQILPGRVLRILTLAALKYGANVNLQDWQEKPITLNRNLTTFERTDIANLTELAWRFSELMSFGKALGSGAELRISKLDIVLSNPSYYERIAAIEDPRLERNAQNLFATLPSISMLPSHMSEWYSAISTTDRWIMLTLPAWQADIPPEATPPKVVIPGYHNELPLQLNYIFSLYDLSDLRRLANLANHYLESLYGMGVEKLLSTLHSLSVNRMLRNIEDDQQAQIFYLTGMGWHSISALSQWIETWRHYELSPDSEAIKSAYAKQPLNTLMVSEEALGTIDLREPGSGSFMFKFGPMVLVDWTSLPYFIVDMLNGSLRRSEMANIKGAQYEVDLLDWLRMKLPNLQILLAPNTKLRSGGRQFGEIDLAFQVGSIGFVIDCKAYSTSPELLRGDAKAVNTRWQYTESWLGQITRTANSLSSAPTGDNYSLPDTVIHLVPLVCSAHIEPIFDFDDRHLITPDQPRICTPLELVDILTSIEPSVLLDNDYTFRITHA